MAVRLTPHGVRRFRNLPEILVGNFQASFRKYRHRTKFQRTRERAMSMNYFDKRFSSPTAAMVARTALQAWTQQAAGSAGLSGDMKNCDIESVGRALARVDPRGNVRAAADHVAPFMSGDFAVLVGIAVESGAQAIWENLQKSTRFASEILVPDFRENAFLGMAPPPLALNREGLPIPPGLPLVTRQTGRVETFAAAFSLSDHAITNDRAGVFVKVGEMLAISAAAKQSDLLFDALTSNPSMADGSPWLSESAGNRSPTPDALTVLSLSEAIARLRAQAVNDLKLNLPPRFLIVGPDEELQGRMLVKQYFDPEELSVIADPRLEGAGFFVTADPAIFPSIAKIQLADVPVSVTVQRRDAGMSFKVVADLGAVPLSRAGIFWNPPA